MPLYATGLDATDLVGSARRCVDQGYQAVKVRIGFDESRDLANVEAVRRAVGDQTHLMVDANMAYDVESAQRMADALRPYNLYWLESRCSLTIYRGIANSRSMSTYR